MSTTTTIPDAVIPTDVRRQVLAVGWVPQVVSERDALYIRLQLTEGQRDDALADLDRMTDLAGVLFTRVRELEDAQARRLARLADHGRPGRLAAWWAAVVNLWQGIWGWFETPASTGGTA